MNERARPVFERVGCIHLGRHRRRGGVEHYWRACIRVFESIAEVNHFQTHFCL